MTHAGHIIAILNASMERVQNILQEVVVNFTDSVDTLSIVASVVEAEDTKTSQILVHLQDIHEKTKVFFSKKDAKIDEINEVKFEGNKPLTLGLEEGPISLVVSPPSTAKSPSPISNSTSATEERELSPNKGILSVEGVKGVEGVEEGTNVTEKKKRGRGRPKKSEHSRKVQKVKFMLD